MLYVLVCRYLLSLWKEIPTFVHNVFNDPLLYVNLHVPKADIQFDDFRVRDAELVSQIFERGVGPWLVNELGVESMPMRGMESG